MMARAFVYTETDNSPESPRKGKPIYTIHYNEHFNGGCSKIQSPDEDFFKAEIANARRKNNVTLVSKLPPKIQPVEGAIERRPYDLSSLK